MGCTQEKAMEKITKTDDEWKQQLTAEQYKVARKHGTERAFSGEYHATKDPGTYQCICCGQDLFSSDAKFDSGTGWPSFFQPVSKEAVAEKDDRSWFMTRTEVLCSRCDAPVTGFTPSASARTMGSAASRCMVGFLVVSVGRSFRRSPYRPCVSENVPLNARLTRGRWEEGRR